MIPQYRPLYRAFGSKPRASGDDPTVSQAQTNDLP